MGYIHVNIGKPGEWDDCGWLFRRKARGRHYTCLCGLRHSEGHDEFCPFPYYGSAEGTIDYWETMREKAIEIEHTCEQACNSHDIRGRRVVEMEVKGGRPEGTKDIERKIELYKLFVQRLEE